MEYRKATNEDLEAIWNKDIAKHPGDVRYVNWKKQYIENNQNGKCATFVVVDGTNPIGQITILFSPDCSPVKNKPLLCDGISTANMNAFRIEKQYEGQGHVSRLVKMAENYAFEHGIKTLTIGAEAKESRNLGIYLDWGYNTFVMHEIYEGDLVIYYKKEIA